MPSLVDICLVLGPHNSGCNRVAISLAEALPGTIRVDGHQGLPPDVVLGSHKNEFSQAGLLTALLEGRVPIGSMGPGTLLNFKGLPVFLQYLITVLGDATQVSVTLLLPRSCELSEDAIKVFEGVEKDALLREDSSLFADMRALYLSTPDDEKKKSALFEIFKKVVLSLALVVRKIVFFPAVEELSEPHKLRLVHSVQSLARPKIEGTPRFSQKRFLTQHGNEKVIHHITIEYDTKGVLRQPAMSDPLQHHVGDVIGKIMTGLSSKLTAQLAALNVAASTILSIESLHALIPSQFPVPTMLQSCRELKSTLEHAMSDYGCLNDSEFMKTLNIQLGKTLKIILESSKRHGLSNDLTKIIEDLNRQNYLKVDSKGELIVFIVFPGLFEGELGTRAHITVNHGIHMPSDMRTAAQCFYSRAETITINGCVYTYDAGKDIPVKILQIYYI
jgi:hypothetical protein